MKFYLVLLMMLFGLVFSSVPATANDLEIPAEFGIPDNTLSIVGIPSSRVDSSAGQTSRVELNKSERDEYKLRISLIDGKYYWTSRDNVELAYIHTYGVCGMFIPTNGHGYIKMCNSPDGVSYIEIVSMLDSSISYFGTASFLSSGKSEPKA